MTISVTVSVPHASNIKACITSIDEKGREGEETSRVYLKPGESFTYHATKTREIVVSEHPLEAPEG